MKSSVKLIFSTHAADEIVNITEAASKIADEQEGQLTLDDIVYVLATTDKAYADELPQEGADPKVLEFLRILEEYRIKCEDEGNYLEAARAHRQLGVLRKQEEKRQQKAIQARQISEKQDVQLAHNMQFAEFNKSWDKFMEEYDQMAQSYIQQMTERHAIVLLEFQKELRNELASKPPKWSRALLDQRRKQHINARNKNYSMAQKLKKQSDKIEVRERREMEQEQAVIFGRREAKFRQQQQTELQALLKRIECRRKEHVKQRNLDSKRLLQRNRNVQAVLESKQAAECQKLFAEIKKVLYSSAVLVGGAAGLSGAPTSTRRYGATESFGKRSNGLSSTKSKSNLAASGGFSPSHTNEYKQDEVKEESKDHYHQHPEQKDHFSNDFEEGSKDNVHEIDPQFMKDSGPRFSSLVYGNDALVEEDSVESGAHGDYYRVEDDYNAAEEKE